MRLKADGVCYLYAVENRVVLPLRATAPITAATVAAPVMPPPRGDGAHQIAREPGQNCPVSAGIGPRFPGGRLPIGRRHKALAAFPPSSSWRSSGRASAALAEERALEGCQVRHGAPCTLVAVDDVLQPADAAAVRRPMPRAEYDGPFDPQKIPAVDDALRHRPDVTGYRAAKGPKAAAYHPPGRLLIASGAASQREAEETGARRMQR